MDIEIKAQPSTDEYIAQLEKEVLSQEVIIIHLQKKLEKVNDSSTRNTRL